MQPPNYRIRPAAPPDGPGFLRLVEELAVFERLAPPDAQAGDRLLEDAFGAHPKFELVVVEETHSNQLVSYAVTLHTYSTFLAKPTLYLEDLYVSPAHRGNGLSKTVLAYLAKRALERGCGRIEGIVLDWNERARKFYAKTGAKELSEWTMIRFDDQALAQLASSLRPSKEPLPNTGTTTRS